MLRLAHALNLDIAHEEGHCAVHGPLLSAWCNSARCAILASSARMSPDVSAFAVSPAQCQVGEAHSYDPTPTAHLQLLVA